MNQIDSLAVIAGIIISLGGAVLTIVGFFFFPVLFYGIPILIVGVVILATLKKQEFIEPIKHKKAKK